MAFAKKTFILTLTVITSTSFATSERDLQDALGSSNWGDRFANPTQPAQSTSSSSSVDVDRSTSADESCERNDQTSIPYKSFLQLLQNKSLSISHDPETGLLRMNGGMMISNCNSMLRYNFSQAQSGRPYLFQVEVGRPAGCSGDTCTYRVDVADDADNPGIKTGEMEIEVEPNYFGYMECLERTGVFNNGQIDADKIVATEFNHTENGVYSSAELAFYSRGPLSQQRGARYGEVEANGGSCDFFEQIQENGLVLYSEEDNERFRLENTFDRICTGGDYRIIEDNLNSFREFRSMYQILKQVRDIYLLNEIKEIHTKLQRNDYSTFSAEEITNMRDVIEDYYEMVVRPKQAKIGRLYDDLNSTRDSARQAALRAEIDELTAELIKYNKAPYLTKSDYDNMKSFIRRAPLEQDAWRDAAIALFSASNTAYHYSRYQSGSRLDDLSISSTRSLIESDIRVETDMLTRLGNLASDPELSYAREYSDVASSIQQSQQAQYQALRQFQMQEMQYMQQHCLNPRKYWINRQRCVSEVQQNIQDAQYATSMYAQDINQDIAYYNGLSQQWAQIEAARNGSARTQPTNVNYPREFNPQSYDFNFRNPAAPGTGNQRDFWSRVGRPGQSMQQQQFPQGMNQQQQLWYMQQQQRQQYPYSNNNGASANWNFSWGTGNQYQQQQFPPQQYTQFPGQYSQYPGHQQYYNGGAQGGDFWSRVGGSPTSQFRQPMSLDPRYQGGYTGNANYNYHLNQPTYTNTWGMPSTPNYYGPAPAGQYQGWP